jgi:uncharacterized protein YxjI
MKLYIKQKVFSWRDKFSVMDEKGAERWFAQGEFFSWGRKLHVYNAMGQEAAFIRQKLASFLSRYIIELDGQSYTLVKHFTFFKPRFSVENTNWAMDGNFWEHEYAIKDGNDGNEYVMRMSKQWFTWGDSYELDIPDERNELLALCIALAVDCMNADQRNASSS